MSRSRIVTVVEGRTVELFTLTPALRDLFVDIHRTGRWPRGRGKILARRALAKGWIGLVGGHRYGLTAKGRARAIAFVSCPCGWWQSHDDIDQQGSLDHNLADHRARRESLECKA